MRPAVAIDLADSAFDFARVVRAVILGRVELAALVAIACEGHAITGALRPVTASVAMVLGGDLLRERAHVDTALLASTLPERWAA